MSADVSLVKLQRVAEMSATDTHRFRCVSGTLLERPVEPDVSRMTAMSFLKFFGPLVAIRRNRARAAIEHIGRVFDVRSA